MAEDTNKPVSDFLDQSEIDKLLAQNVEPAQAKSVLLGGTQPLGQNAKIEPYDIRPSSPKPNSVASASSTRTLSATSAPASPSIFAWSSA